MPARPLRSLRVSTSRRALSSWRAFVRKAAKLPDVEWVDGRALDVDTYERLGTRPGRLFVFGKPTSMTVFGGVLGEGTSSYAWMMRGAPPTEHALEFLRRELRSLRADAAWVGDLDPFHLSSFLAYRKGGIELRGRALKVGYLGIDDRLLALLEAQGRRAKPARSLEASCIPLDAFERENLARLEDLIDLEAVVGPRCANILRSGSKLELEAFSAHLHGEPFVRRVVEHLRDARPTV